MIIAAATLLAVSLFMVIRQLIDYYMGDKVYSEAMEIAGIQPMETESAVSTESETKAETEEEPETEEPEIEIETESETEIESETEPETETETETETEAETEPVPQISFEEMISSVNLDALRVYNNDVVGWIAVPYSALSYPIVQGDDNDYYLNHTWNKKLNSVGAIFMEHLVSPDFTDFNTIIYGHRMGNGTMFNSLAYYSNYFYWQSNPYIYIVTDEGIRRYDIYATYEASVDSITYALGITESDDKQEFIKHTLDSSVINTGIVPTEDDLILTLSTCTRSGSTSTRWVVHAILNTEE